jgi:4a-hydroxytetrahydrobiopterin dehydratase
MGDFDHRMSGRRRSLVDGEGVGGDRWGMAVALNEMECGELLKSLPEWKIVDGQLAKVFRFGDYLEGVEFARRCGEIAEEMNHHPDLLVQWRKVTVTISTHSCGALTKLDFEYGLRVEEDE